MINPFAQYRTAGVHEFDYKQYQKPYKGIPISRLEEFKEFRRRVKASTADSRGITANVNWRYVFRGPRLKNSYGDCDSFTMKCNAHSFDVYRR